ncbi:flagellar protein FliT [Pandoraea terrae]|uniref:Flagellar protein FliT n=1 Tax=Pandoraea terrae TaxID=1537710 RepID=A0A5E4YG66_9BURK|nr:flagellar protein FliT [Pandoraea terrae]VVE47714.1 flagellar protein FliT [Pandoraea terrae]
MNNATTLLNCYERIAGLTERMLVVARDGDWEALVDLEAQYRAQVDAIKQLDAELPLDEAQRARKHAIIRRILADDAAIRDLVVPRLAHLDAMIISTRRQRALHEVYGLNLGV